MLLIVMLLGFDYCKDDDDDDGRMWWLWSSCYVLAWIKVSKMMIAYVIWISIIMCYVCLCWEDEFGLCLCDAMIMAYVMNGCYGICWCYVLDEAWVVSHKVSVYVYDAYVDWSIMLCYGRFTY